MPVRRTRTQTVSGVVMEAGRVAKGLQTWVLDHRQVVFPVAFFAAVFIINLALNWYSSGPIFLADELSYLNNASTLAGHHADVSSSYYAGYSLLLAPLFVIFSDPQTIWHGIVVLNALLVTASLAILLRVLKELFPRKSYEALLLPVALAALYPSWAVMTGYAFTTPAFMLFAMLGIWASLRIDYRRPITLLLPALIFGYLGWIHPVGLAVAAAWLVTLLISFRLKNWWSLVLATGVVLVMAATYHYGISAWLHDVMGISKSLSIDHYSAAESDWRRLVSLHFVAKFVVMSAGQIAAVLVASFGVAGLVGLRAFKTLRARFKKPVSRSLGLEEICLFLSLGLVFIVAVGSINFYLAALTTHVSPRLDFWIYGRYVDMFLLPVLGVGFLLSGKLKTLVSVGVFILLTGVVLKLAINPDAFLNYINVISLWPRYVLPEQNVLVWFILGAIGTLYLGYIKRIQLLPVALLLFVLTMHNQIQTHSFAQKQPQYHPSGLVTVIRNDIPKDQCVGYEGRLTDEEDDSRLYAGQENLYRFYLYDYKMRQMSAADWLANDGCDVYIARRIDALRDSKQATIIGQEEASGIYLIVKKPVVSRMHTSNEVAKDFYLNTQADGSRCILDGCFDIEPKDLQGLSLVGKLTEDNLSTDGRPGFLFYGPFKPLKAGDYQLVMDADVENAAGAVLDIIDGDDAKTVSSYKKVQLKSGTKGSIKVPFSLPTDQSDLQIRLQVSSQTKLTFRYYEIR